MEVAESQQPAKGLDRLEGGEFVSEGVQVTLTLTTDGISWTSTKDNKSVDLEWRDVIRCHRGKVSAKTPLDVQEETEKEPFFTVHYIEKHKDNVWKHKHKTFQSSNKNFDDILSIMWEKSKKDRPGRLLVLINPTSGRGKGEAQYRRVIAPLFKLAQIDTDLIVSKNPKHPEEIGRTYDFSKVDGVVIVGGDGTLQMLIHTWLPRLQLEAGLDIDNPETKLKPLTCPVGIMPTGTGNGQAQGAYGCFDVATAALNIISGSKRMTNILSINSGGRHRGSAAIILGSGTLSDLVDTQGAAAKIMALLRARREFYIQLEYLPYTSPSNTEGSSVDQTTSDQAEWVSIEGYYTGIFCLPVIMTPNEATGKMNFNADGSSEGVTLILEKQCGRLKYYRWLYKMIQIRKDMLKDDFLTVKEVKVYKFNIVQREGETKIERELERLKDDFLTVMEVKACKFNIVQREGETKTERELRLEKNLNIDGEIRRLENTDVSVRNHQNMMEVYGTFPTF